MSYLYVTQPGTRLRTAPAEIIHDWSIGLEFRVYRFANKVTKAASHHLIAAGFTHVRVVWQRPDLSVTSTDIDISQYILI